MRSICFVVLLAACSDDASPMMSIDALLSSPDAAGSCSEANDHCAGETICMGGTCVVAYPRTYNFSAIQVTATNANNGNPWDPEPSLADIFVDFNNALAHVSTTETQTDQTTATFAGPFPVMLTGTGALLISASDDDGGQTQTEQIITCALVGSGEQLPKFRTRTVSCANGGVGMTMTVAPQ